MRKVTALFIVQLDVILKMEKLFSSLKQNQTTIAFKIVKVDMLLNKIYSLVFPHGVVVIQIVVEVHNIKILLYIMIIHSTHNA